MMAGQYRIVCDSTESRCFGSVVDWKDVDPEDAFASGREMAGIGTQTVSP